MEAFDPPRPLPPATVIEPAGKWKLPDFAEIWRYRDLMYVLARRDIVVRYKQAIVGLGWAVLQPLLMAGLFALFLGVITDLPSESGIPYAVFAVSGMVLWIPFGAAVNMCTLSTLSASMLIDKVYFPRIMIPIAAAAPFAVDMLIGLVVAVAVGIGFGVYPDARILAAPFVILLCLLLATGFGTLFSALNVKYRDTTLAVGFVLLAGLFITPITYPFDLVPSHLQTLYSLNPMVGVLELFRWSLLGTSIGGTGYEVIIPLIRVHVPVVVLVPILGAPILLVVSALYFEKTQRSFADVI
jgi:lipopolysaccharide transport system permease protein